MNKYYTEKLNRVWSSNSTQYVLYYEYGDDMSYYNNMNNYKDVSFHQARSSELLRKRLKSEIS